VVDKVVFEFVAGQGLRALKGFELELGSGCNWVVGENGVGKTTVLEALYLLARGRSFRGRRMGPLVGWDAQRAVLEGRLRQGERAQRRRWDSQGGLEGDRQTGRTLVRLIGDQSFELIEGGPALRRRFVDWNLVQADSRYLDLWGRFRRVAGQRNAWLRSGGRGVRVWDSTYAALHEAIDQARGRWVDRLQLELDELSGEFPMLSGVQVRWRSSMGSGRSAVQALEDGLPLDIQRGFSASGPSRGDFVLERAGRAWSGSRGENKVFVVLCQIGAGRLLEQDVAVRSSWLVDDLGSDLSRRLSEQGFDLLVRQDGQVVFTALDEPRVGVEQTSVRLFHVEQGKLHRR
jgi:DNA replication and repair protein RecF